MSLVTGVSEFPPGSPVSGLLIPSGPADVPSFVVPVVIYSIQGHAIWTRPDQPHDVFNEHLGIMPPITNTNATSSPVFILQEVLVVAPGHHVYPSAVQRMLSTVMPGQAMDGSIFTLRCRLCTHFRSPAQASQAITINLGTTVFPGCVSPQTTTRFRYRFVWTASRRNNITQRNFIDSAAVTQQPCSTYAIRTSRVRYSDFLYYHATAKTVTGFNFTPGRLTHRCSPAPIRSRARNRLVCHHRTVPHPPQSMREGVVLCGRVW